MGTMVRAEGIHGHIVGLRMVLGHLVRHHQPDRSTWWSRHGPVSLQGRHSLRITFWHRIFAGKALHLRQCKKMISFFDI